ncbi:MAG: hypothetical protein DMG11_26815 [Acidobacteria bacterium]|nr:MAG: hypothetical protein DMG11_26815 [Acidobacteriota bacterium]
MTTGISLIPGKPALIEVVNEFAECIPLLTKGINILAESREGGSAISSLESPILEYIQPDFLQP